MLGLDKAGVSRKIARLEAQGLIETQPRSPGKPVQVNVAAFLAATEQSADAIRTANGVKAKAADTADPRLSREQTRRVAIQADLAQIELDRQRGVLVPVEEVREAMARAAGELVRVLEMLPGRATEIAAAIARDGEPAVRAALKDFVRNARERLAAAMTLLAKDSGTDDE